MIPIVGLFVDLWNWGYTRSRIQLLRREKEIWKVHRLKISLLGVLYTMVEINKQDVPEVLIGRYLIGRLRVIDDALVAINLDGLIRFEFMIYAEDNVKNYVLVKFIPIMPHWNGWYLFTSTITGGILAWIVIHFNLVPKIVNFINQWV